MTETTLTQTTVDDVLAELAALQDPKIRAVNEKHGDDHGVNLSKLRGIASLKPDAAKFNARATAVFAKVDDVTRMFEEYMASLKP